MRPATKFITPEQRARLRDASLYRGLFARLARELNVDRSHVRRVALGARRSRRIEAALHAALEQIEGTGTKSKKQRRAA